VTAVVTDLGLLEPDAETGELTLTRVHPGVSADDARAATGWPLRVADDLEVVDPPSDTELAALRALRTVTGEDAGE
jgi:glutaconate CoA-transferase subunit B